MAILIGHLQDEPMYLEYVDGTIFINAERQPIKNVEEHEILALEKALGNPPEGDLEGQIAWQNARRIEFLVSLLGRTFGDDCQALLETLIGTLHFGILEYLGETDGLESVDDYVAARLSHIPGHDDGHESHDGCDCHDHDHHHDHGCSCGSH